MQSLESTRRHWYVVLLMFILLKPQGCQAVAMKRSGKDGAITHGDCRRALRNEVLYDLLEYVIRRVLGDAGALTADKRATLTGLMRELVN